jgi:hypothetical protein
MRPIAFRRASSKEKLTAAEAKVRDLFADQAVNSARIRASVDDAYLTDRAHAKDEMIAEPPQHLSRGVRLSGSPRTNA